MEEVENYDKKYLNYQKQYTWIFVILNFLGKWAFYKCVHGQ